METRTYSELIKLGSFKERYEYLRLNGVVGEETFGFDRFVNQNFYKSPEWKAVRDRVIVRDNGCDLGVEGHELGSRILIHHMNPLAPKDIKYQSGSLLAPEFLISTSHSTHNAIHYGDESLLISPPTGRCKNDTCPWKRR
jgi:hypothetical protein